jgi:hypothetical protein
MLSAEAIANGTKCINEYIAKKLSDWKVKRYILGTHCSIVVAYRLVDAKNHIFRGMIVNHQNLDGKVFYEQEFTSSHEKYDQNWENFWTDAVEFYLFEEQGKILILEAKREREKPKFVSFEMAPELSVSGISLFPDKLPIGTCVGEIHDTVTRLIRSNSDRYLGIHLTRNTFCVLDIDTWKLITSLITEPDEIPMVNDFQLFFGKNEKLAVLVVNVQHEMAAHCRQRLDISYKGGFLNHSYLGNSGIKSYHGRLDGDKFTLTVETARAGTAVMHYDLTEKD